MEHGWDWIDCNRATIIGEIMNNPLEKQIGGDHYKKMKIQTMEFSMANNLNACQHTAIKYICRYKDKNGIEDIDKAIHTLELLKQLEYGE